MQAEQGRFRGIQPHMYMKSEAGMRFATLISFFKVESQNFMPETDFSEVS